MGKKNTKNNKKKAVTGNASAANGGGLMVDPARVRFQHARIRPYFSGCGRRLVAELTTEILI